MRKEEFEAWLCGPRKLESSTANSRVGNCKRIESFEGNLDVLFEEDGLSRLLERLVYSKEDQRQNVPPRHKIPINGNIYNGTATLRSAVKLYQEFANSGATPVDTPPIRKLVKKPVKATNTWPTWDMPISETILALTKMATPYVRFLHPDVVKQVVEDNEHNRLQWRKKLISRGIDPGFYLWDKSSCAFPGIRRYSGNKENAHYRKHLGEEKLHIPDALRLDDNSFPKHIWSFIFRGKVFQNFGPEGYSLAHLADHKNYKNRRDDEFESVGITPENIYGLYSCASNTVYAPQNLIRLTDFNMHVRLLLLHKAQSLYGDFCNLLPQHINSRRNIPQNGMWIILIGALLLERVLTLIVSFYLELKLLSRYRGKAMASFHKRGSYQWEVLIRKHAYATTCLAVTHQSERGAYVP